MYLSNGEIKMKFKVGDKVFGINKNSCTNGFLGVITYIGKESLPYEVKFTNLSHSWPMGEGELELAND